ncbi:MSMEG_1061 family FMN-dependent PPOX-type flavoprotein [Paenibacillus crassostreae]|uniref:Phosphohydrolase n=1 Tax=Paenibacillus crassostreae TaxID=1763538 RepID=A0A167DR07_9BACL|nr:MSMEG_1061 family FMN-dependent PPOX-type flavoprotein [Paenibacillus crassostreae]AOZ91161.1 phosphohydrolase [Paenibacillus crassostreae]OAB74679.1 phosphohydrolase [Paenibacillus crassostreae]
MNNPWNDDIIRSAEELREMIGAPHEAVIKKVVTQIDSHIENFIAKSPLFFLATSGTDGRTDVSPRGDRAGFVKVLDNNRIVFADRPGNRRIDSMLNMLENPQVGMIFLIPPLEEVLRINGRAILTRNKEFINDMQWEKKTTGIAVIIEVEECFIHCPRAFNQAGIWNIDKWSPKDELPVVSELFQAHLKINNYKS